VEQSTADLRIFNPNSVVLRKGLFMLNDVKFAIRRLLKTPGFTVSAVIVLALGIGVNTAVFVVVHTLLLAPPSFSKPAEVVQIFSQDKKNRSAYRGFSYPTYRDIREQNDVFTDVLGWKISILGLGRKGDTRRSVGAIVSSNYFSVLGVQMARGRAFLPEEEIPGRAVPVAVVSYAYWQNNNFDPGVLGSEILLDGRPFTVVGVAPRGFSGTSQLLAISVWTPFSAYNLVSDSQVITGRPFGDRSGQELMIIARLKPGLTAAAARPRLEGLAGNLENAFPVEQKDQTFTITAVPRLSVSSVPQSEQDLGGLTPMLLGMSAVVLIVACLNLANMLLAQGTARRKEIAIRLAVGGNRRQIVRQLLIEGFALAFAGGAAGLILGIWSSGLLVASAQRLVPFDIAWTGGPNVAVMLATFGFCTAATIAFALGPALRITRLTVAADLKEQASEELRRRRWRLIPGHPLVVVQISFSLALLTATALFIRAADRAASVETGLKPGSSVLVETDARLAGYDRQRAQQLYQRLNQELSALPGVEQAAISATLPFGTVELSRNVQRAGLRPAAEAKPATAAEGLAFNATWNSVDANYFAAAGLPFNRGRGFGATDSMAPGGPPVAVVDEILAKHLWPDGGALGQYIQYARPNAPLARSDSGHIGIGNDLSGEPGSEETIQIVGIVPAVRHGLFEKNPAGEIYIPFGRGFQNNVFFLVRFRQFPQGGETAAAELIRTAMRQTDPALPILSLRTFEQHMDASVQLWLVRAVAALFSVFGVLALGLALVGLYGVRAYSVARRSREIGIRMALGARSVEVLGMFMREGSITLFSGLGLGLLLAIATGRIVSGFLYQTSPLDPLAFATASIFLALAALAATWIPARRATRVDPLKALRGD
jgi:putative ABC transport system permease protein